MNTDAFDKQMEEFRKIAKAGVPFPTGSLVPFKGGGSAPPEAKAREFAPDEVEARATEVNDLKAQVKLLLDDNERLVNEIGALEGRLARVARLTEDEKAALWIRKYDELKKVYDLKIGWD